LSLIHPRSLKSIPKSHFPQYHFHLKAEKNFLIGKQYSVEHRKPGGNGNNQHTAVAKKTVPEELCQIDTIPPTAADASVRKQIAERNNVSESYGRRSRLITLPVKKNRAFPTAGYP